MQKHKIFALSIIAVLVTACSDYVEVEQANLRTPKYTDDYQYLLNNISLFEPSYALPLLSSDDIEVTSAGLLANLSDAYKRTYVWDEYYFTESQTDADWMNLYKQVYTANVVLEGVMSSQDGTDEQKKAIYAEALFQRAYSYLVLMNIYSPIYKAAESDQILGVPLLLSPDLSGSLKRAAAKTVYNQIVKDVHSALPQLPTTPANTIHPGKTAAYALLARTYEYMQQYDSAGIYAQKALDRQNTLLDLRTMTTSTLPKRLVDPEMILSKTASFYYTLSLSPALMSLFDTRDRRYALFVRDGSANYPSFVGKYFYRYQWVGESVNTGLTVPEMMLIKAESLVRSGSYPEGIDVINTLRKKRFNDVDYADFAATSTTDALKKVIEERRRELMGRGFRWFDQRRLSNDNGLVETVTRVLNNTTYTLTPGSNRYTYPIAPNLLVLNPEIEQNPR